jgi:hypothetical protein
MTRLAAGKLLLLMMLGLAAPAWAVFKCEAGGRIAYTDTPCEGGKELEVGTAAPADTTSATRQAAQEKRQLKTLERERHKREAADERALKKASSESAARHKKCAAHALRQKHANEDVARTTGIANEKARRKARRITEAYEAECGRWYEREMSVAR